MEAVEDRVGSGIGAGGLKDGVPIKLVKILQELAESKPKVYPKHQRERWTTITQTNNKITGDKPS